MSVKRHRDIVFEVTRGDHIESFSKFPDAAEHAFVLAVAGHKVTLDVIVSSRAAARVWGGDDAVEQYDEDPEASIFERYELTVNCQGRVP